MDAGLTPQPNLDPQLPDSQPPASQAAPQAQAETADMLPRVLRDAAKAKAGMMPAWLKAARRARWQSRLRNGMAWMATLAVVGGIIAVAAALMGILPPAGVLMAWM
jgi:hypothetical protein